MTLLSNFVPEKSALLLMDFQQAILENHLPGERASALLDRTAGLLGAARAKRMPVIHVAVSFRPGHPEVSDRNRVFSRIKHNGLFVHGAAGTAIHPLLEPVAGEPVVNKHRVGAFAGTDLGTLLRARQVETLVMAGIITSGVVLSTVRHAFDHDYQLVVVGDCCADSDAEAHRVLLDKVITKHADVVTAAEVAAALGTA